MRHQRDKKAVMRPKESRYFRLFFVGSKPTNAEDRNYDTMRLGLILPYFKEKLGWDYTLRYDYWEERLHLLATMLSLFPFTKTKDLADEFMISEQEVKFWAWFYGIKKNKTHIRRCCIENGREQFIKNLWAKKRKDIRNYDRRREKRNKVTTGTDENT